MALSKKELDDIKKLTKEIGDELSKIGSTDNPFENLDTSQIQNAADQIKIMQRFLANVRDEVRELNTDFSSIFQTAQNIVEELDASQNAAKRMTSSFKGLVGQASKLNYEKQSGVILSEKEVIKLANKSKIEATILKDNAKQLLDQHKMMGLNEKEFQDRLKGLQAIDKKKGGIDKKEAATLLSARRAYEDQGNVIAKLVKASENRLGLEDEFKKKVGFGTRAVAGLDKAFQKAGLPSLGISETLNKTREAFIDINNKTGKTASRFQILKLFSAGLADKLSEALSFSNLIEGAVAMMFKALKAVDQESGEFAKNQGISYERTLAIRGEMNEVARSSKDILNTSKALMETQGRLNEIFGQSVVFSGEMADQFSSLNTRLKMSAETQGVFAIEMMKTGKDTDELVKTQTIQTMELNKQKGLQMSVKQVQDAIGKTSKALQLTFKGSSKELTNQVMQAKALGTNMQGVEKIAGHLLDFESSIASELEAELLLGKDINLEKARQAALEGDMGKVAEEVAKQKGIMQAFETKNVIAQEAAAKALGMSRDDLAEMVMEQQKMDLIRKKGFSSMNEAQDEFNKLREQGLTAEQAAKRIGDENLMQQFESASVAERLAAIMAQIQEIFIGMAEPVLGLVDGMMKLVGGAENLGKILTFIAGTYLIIKGAQLAMKGFQAGQLAFEATKAAIMGTQAVAATTTNAMTTFGLGTVIAVGAVAAALGALAAYTFMDDGMIAGGRSGYGDRVLLGPEGAIAFNNKDTIVAGTNLFANDMAMAPEGSIDLSSGDTEMKMLMKESIKVQRETANKSMVMKVDSTELGRQATRAQNRDDRMVE